jgi:Protein of unknown function (DUF1488)
VRFWGHDSAIEASFFISEHALKRIQPNAHLDESGFLNAFDSNRDLICAAAGKIYVRGSRGSYDLVATSFLKQLLRFSAGNEGGRHMRRPGQKIGLRRYGIWGAY